MKEIALRQESLTQLLKQAKDDSVIRRACAAVKVEHTINAPLISSHSDEDKFMIHKFITKQLDRLQKKYNLPQSRQYDSDTLVDVAYDLMEQYKHETLEDFVLFFKLVRQGRIKVLEYERFGFDKIQQGFAKYLDQYKLPKLENAKKMKNKELNDVTPEAASGYAKVLKTIEDSMKVGRETKATSSPTTWTQKDELDGLKASLPYLSNKQLESLKKQYEDSSVYAYNDGSKPKGLVMVEQEISRRSD